MRSTVAKCDMVVAVDIYSHYPTTELTLKPSKAKACSSEPSSWSGRQPGRAHPTLISPAVWIWGGDSTDHSHGSHLRPSSLLCHTTTSGERHRMTLKPKPEGAELGLVTSSVFSSDLNPLHTLCLLVLVSLCLLLIANHELTDPRSSKMIG